jgi:hypothetical protein
MVNIELVVNNKITGLSCHISNGRNLLVRPKNNNISCISNSALTTTTPKLHMLTLTSFGDPWGEHFQQTGNVRCRIVFLV